MLKVALIKKEPNLNIFPGIFSDKGVTLSILSCWGEMMHYSGPLRNAKKYSMYLKQREFNIGNLCTGDERAEDPTGLQQ